MVFNGLTKSDLVVFNALQEIDLSQPVSATKIANLTCYHTQTVYQALKRLVSYEIVERHRHSDGQPYRYQIKEESYVVLDT